MGCLDCKEKEAGQVSVPYIVHESALARCERTTKRLLAALLLSLILMAATNAGWLYYLSLYDFESYQQDGEGVNVIGDSNGVTMYGTEGTQTDKEESEKR